MANVDRAAGLRPVKYLNGTPWNGKVTMYYKSGAGVIYKGSCVKHAGTAGADGKTPACTIAGATDKILGVAVGFGNQKNIAADVTSLNRVYCPASTAMYIAVVDDPNVVFEVQEDNGSSAHLAATNVGENVVLVNSSAGSTTTGWSSAEIDSDSTATAYASHPLLLVGVADREDNSMGSSADHTKWLVRIADHHFAIPATGV